LSYADIHPERSFIKTGDEGRIEMPARQTGSPMTFLHKSKQYIVVAVTHGGANVGA